MKRKLLLGLVAGCDGIFNGVKSNAAGFLLMGFMLMMSGVMFGQFNIAAGSTDYTQNFNTLTSGGWTNNTTLTGWYARTDATASITTYAANTGTTTAAGLYAYGIAGTNPVTDRALGYATSNGYTGAAGSGKNYIGWRLKNNTGAAISSITVTWTGEQWRKDNTVNQSIVLSYQTPTSPSTTVTDLVAGTWSTTSSSFTSPVITSGTAALDGNASANRTAGISVTITVSLAAGEEIMLRWEDVNDAGNDHHLAIDDVTVNATVVPTGFTATFNGNGANGGGTGGTGANYTQTASTGTTLTANTFTRTGYRFDGWSTTAGGALAFADGANYTFDANITLYARWTPTYTLTYNGNTNTSGTPPTDGSSPYTATSTVTVLGNTGSLVKTGYTFSGWNTAADGNGTDRTASSTFAMPAANTILYAKWTGNVSYNANGGTGTVTDAANYLPGQAVTTASGAGFTRAGYAFLNWNTATDGSGATHTASQVAAFNFGGNITLYAIWNPVGSHTVIFEANGGTGAMANQTESTATALSNNTFTRTSYNFNGWNTAANGSGTPYTNGQTYSFASNMTLYAQWVLAPALSVSPTSLNFGSQCISGTYGPNSFTISGVALTAANITVAALSGYTFSTTSGGTYTTSLSLTQPGGTYSQEIFVRFNPVLVQSYNGNIAISGGDASSINVAASGSGTFTAPTVTSAAATLVTAQAAALNGNVTSTGCPTIVEKGFVYALTATDATPTVGEGGVTKTIVAGTATGSYTLALPSLSASAGYSFNSYVYNGTTYYYGTVRQFTTADALVLTGTLAHGSVCPTVAAAPQNYTITNNSNATVTGISVGSNNPEFAVSGLSSTSIIAGGTATYDVTFTPATAGGKSATITVTSAAATVTNTVTGTGITIVAQSSTTSPATAITNVGATLQAGAPTFGICPATTAKGFVISETSVNSNPIIGGTGVANESVTLGTAVAYNKAITGLTPGVNYTYKSYVYNGTTYTYGATQNFTILSPANHLAFVSVPATGTVATNLASFTVQARRPDNTVDTYYTGTITIAKASGSGVLSGTVSTAAVAGVATFTTAQFSAAGTYTISASSGSLTGTTSGNIVISSAPIALANYTFTGTFCSNYTPTNVAANIAFSNIAPTGITCNSNFANAFSGNASWGGTSIDTSTRYLEFTVTPNTDYLVTANSLVFDVWRSGAGATNYDVRSSIDAYATTLGTAAVTTSSSTKTISLGTSFENLTLVTFRIYGYNGGTGDFRLDNITLNGNVISACSTPANPIGTFAVTQNCGNTSLAYTHGSGQPVAGVSYYWQTSATGEDVTHPTSSPFVATTGATYYVRAKSTVGNCWSAGTVSQAVTIVPAHAITTEPTDQSVPVGTTATFTVAASNATAYQWQVNTGSGWNNVSTGTGATTASYTTPNTTLAMSSYQYKVIVSGTSPCPAIESAIRTLTVMPVVTWARLQWPPTHTMEEGSTFDVYGRVFADGVTNGAGQGAGLTGQIGYSSINSDPSGAGWTWVAASYNTDDLPNNDEYRGALGTGMTPGTYYYATRFRAGTGTYVYGDTAGVWSSIANNGVLTITSSLVDWGNFHHPSTGSVVLGDAYNVYGRVYEAGVTNTGSPGAGIIAEVGYSTTNTHPDTWSNWFSASFNVDAGNDDEYMHNIGANFPSNGTYYLAFRYRRTGSTQYVYGGTAGVWNNDNATVTVTAPREINIRQNATNIASGGSYAFGTQTSGTSSSAITFTVENTGQENLSVGALSISGTHSSEFSITQVAPTLPLVVGGTSSTTFTVTFSPTSTGSKTAQLSLVNNDADENPYVINLTGTGGTANDNCSGAVSLTINATATAGTFVGATPQSGFSEKDVWYSFSPGCTGEHIITVSDFTGTDLDFTVYATNCPTNSSATAFRNSGTSNIPETNTFTYNAGTTYLIRIFKHSNAGADTTFNIRIASPTLGTPANITANPTTLCQGGTVTFTAAVVANATSYAWTVPADWTINSSSSNTMSATVGATAGSVTAKAVNCYGEGIQRSQSFTPGVIPATPGTISGSALVCEGAASNTYTITAVSGATSYTWTLPGGWSGTSITNSITATAGTTGGNITVTANSACGSSTAQTLAVTVTNVTAPAGSISVSSNTCGTTTLAYSAPSANLYWQTSASGTSTANPTTSNYVVNTSAPVYVRHLDGTCWSVGNATFTPTIIIAPSITTQPAPQSVTTGATATFTVVATGTVSGYQWQVNTGSGFANVSTGTGGTTANYSVPATLGMNGYTYQCIISGTAPCANITSSSVSLNVANGPCLSDNFDTNYGNWSGGSGTYNNSGAGNTGNGIGFNDANDAIINAVALLNPASIKFKGRANNASGSYTIKIQRSTSASGPWTDVSTYTTNGSNTGSITNSWTEYDIPLSLTGNHFIRIIMTIQGNGSFFLDDLQVFCGLPCTPPSTPSTPTSNSPQCIASGATISKVGTAPTDEIWYWQTSETGTDIAALNAAATYTVTSVGTTTIYLRSKNTVTDCWSAAASTAVTVNPTTSITAQPLSATKTTGSTAVFSVTATGISMTYQWQVNTGSGWNNVTLADGTGGNTATFTTVASTIAMSGNQYRVVVSGNCGSATSNGLAILTVTAAPLCNALLEENFDYGCTSSADLVSLSGTNWQCFSSCSNTFSYSNTSLNYSEYIGSGIGGAALMTANTDDIKRSFTATATGSVYVSFLLNLNDGTTTTNNHFVDLGNGANNFVARLHTVKINASTFRLGVSKGQSTSANNSGPLNFGTTYLVVFKYEFVAGTNNDRVSLWAFASGVPTSEAAAGAATVTASDNLTQTDATNIQWLALRQENARGLIDGIRVATTWSDALCIGPAITSKTYTWTGGGNSTSWTNNCNWSPLGVPTSIDNIIINTATTSNLNITDSRSIRNFTLNGTGHFDMSSTGILTITGNTAYGGTPTANLHCDSQVFITSTSTQIIPAINYGNLDAIGGNRIFPNGGTIGICAGFNVNPTLHTYTLTGSTVNYYSSATDWVMRPFTYNNLTFSGTGDFSFGYSDPAVNKTVNVLGNFLQTAGTVYLGETSSATATMNIDGNMTITGGTFNVNNITGGTGIINLKGNLSVTGGTLTSASNADTAHLNFIGTNNQTVSGAGTMNVYRSTINKPSGYVDLQRNLEIKRVLTMTKGNIATNANTLTLGESTSNVGTLTRTSGYVIGKMTRWFNSTAVTLFPLGTSSNQNRSANINYASVTAGGRLTAEVVNTAMGSIGSITIPAAGSCSTFDPTTGNNSYWILTNNGINAPSFTASFTTETATPTPVCNLALLHRGSAAAPWANAGTHLAATGTTTNYTVSRSGLTAYGHFGVGKKGDCEATKIWAAGAWTGGNGLAPGPTDIVIFDGNYDTTTLPNVESCECIINPGKVVTIATGKTLTIEHGLTLSDNVTPTDLTDDGKLILVDGASLVQHIDPATDATGNSVNNNTGSIDMERITQPMYRYDYTYWGSPVVGATLYDLSPLTLSDKYYWWHPVNGWTISYGGTEAMIAGKGYIVRAPQVGPYGTNPSLPASYHNYTAHFIGVPNNGIVKHEVASGTGNYNLIGNPYASAVEADDFITENVANGSIEGTLYFWTHNTPIANLQYSASDYAAYTLAGGVGTKEADSDDNDPDNIPIDNAPQGQIAAGQAFFVEGGNGTNAAVIFKNEMRVPGLNNQFFKPAPTEPVDNWDMTGKHRIWLNLKNAQAGFNQILVGYLGNATNGYDTGYDGKSFGGNQVTFYSLNEEKDLTIQARALPFNNQDQVPLGYKTTLNGALTIKIDHYDGLFEGQDIYLEDKLLNIVHDLKAAAYNFTSGAGTFNERFVLRYLPAEDLGNPDHGNIANGVIVYKNNTAIVIKSQLEALEQITVYDLLGRIIFDKAGIGQNELSIQNVVMNEQPLVVKIKLANGQTVNKKIVH